jgi:hypothetical protein
VDVARRSFHAALNYSNGEGNVNIKYVANMTMKMKFTFATADSKTGMSALDSDVPNAGSMTFLCLLWISPISGVATNVSLRLRRREWQMS